MQSCNMCFPECSLLAVSGGWSSWSTCSVACGVGQQTRTCDNPTPQGLLGSPCSGSPTQACDGTNCPGATCTRGSIIVVLLLSDILSTLLFLHEVPAGYLRMTGTFCGGPDSYVCYSRSTCGNSVSTLLPVSTFVCRLQVPVGSACGPYCIRTVADAYAACSADPNCGGVSLCSNPDWPSNSATKGGGQLFGLGASCSENVIWTSDRKIPGTFFPQSFLLRSLPSSMSSSLQPSVAAGAPGRRAPCRAAQGLRRARARTPHHLEAGSHALVPILSRAQCHRVPLVAVELHAEEVPRVRLACILLEVGLSDSS